MCHVLSHPLRVIPDVVPSLRGALRSLQRLVHNHVRFAAKVAGSALVSGLGNNLSDFYGQFFLFRHLRLWRGSKTSRTWCRGTRWVHIRGVPSRTVES